MTDDLSSDSDQRRPGPLARLFDLADAFIDGVHRRLTPVERLPAAVGAVLFAILATTPFWFHHEAEYKSDDILLIARGVETGIWEGLWRNLSRPFCDTWTIEFYRPLFTWTFCLEGNLFGDRPWAYFWVNVVWQALTVGAGYLVLRRMIGARFAALSSLLFVVNPWVANNVNWLVGRCTVTATFFVFCCVLLYLRHVDRKGDRRLEGLFKQLPWAAFGLAFVGVFYRETALFAVVLIFLLDLGEGRRDWRAFRDWCFLTLPFLVYLGVKYLVLGTLIGGYARLAAMQGEPPEGAQGLALLGQYGNALLDLFMPGDGALSGGFDDGLRRWVGFGFLAILIVMCANRRVWRRPMTWVLLAFIVLHISPLLVVDQDVHGGTAQRWYTVM
ncbi:MAG: glycosyltransferase family 39 protein, partial [Planctomycetes bacterium]|nr:glycosyltransferase family 39 protein [Planctomycetota bacterium]